MLLSGVGTTMQTVGAQWLLVDAPDAAALVALVQAASTLPVMLLALAAVVVLPGFPAALGSLLVAGLAWMTVTSTQQAELQLVLPAWVRARGRTLGGCQLLSPTTIAAMLVDRTGHLRAGPGPPPGAAFHFGLGWMLAAPALWACDLVSAGEARRLHRLLSVLATAYAGRAAGRAGEPAGWPPRPGAGPAARCAHQGPGSAGPPRCRRGAGRPRP